MENLDVLLTIDTPENIEFDYEVAGLGSRFLAAAIDTLIILIIQIIAVLTVAALGGMLSEFSEVAPGVVAAILGLVAFGAMWGYYILFELLWNGSSPGKRLVKLRVVRVDGSTITITESIIRNLVRLVDFMPLLYGAGVVTMFVNKNARRLGDYAAGTLVVHDREEISLESLEFAARVARPTERQIDDATADPLASSLPLNSLTDNDISAFQEFLRRRNNLANTEDLAEHMLRIVERRTERNLNIQFMRHDDRLRLISRIVILKRFHENPLPATNEPDVRIDQ